MDKERVLYVDLLRIFAACAVVILHVAASYWNGSNVYTFDWKMFNFYDSLVRFAVPVFVMISGIFFLDSNKPITIKKIYLKYCLRVVIAYIFWSFFYASYMPVYNLLTGGASSDFPVKQVIYEFIFGHYHMWFLFMIAGLYIITPLLRKISADKKMTEYFLLLAIVFSIIVPTLLSIPTLSKASLLMDYMDYRFTLDFAGYFLAGYYLSKYDIGGKWRRLIYILGTAGIIATMVISYIISMNTGAPYGYYGNFTINVMCASIAVFVFFKYEISKIKLAEKTVKTVTFLSSCSFGIYLVHVFYIEFLARFGIDIYMMNPVLSVPIVSIIVFMLSLVTIFAIKKIPVLARYII
ncbi:MAG: acyltransferase [Clostridiaceae bacterium]